MPAMEKQVAREWSHSPEQVFAALTQVVEDGKYRLGGRDDATGRLSFEKGSKWGWIHVFTATVEPAGNGARLDLTVASPPDAVIGLANGLILQKAADKTVNAVDAALADR
ncbi:hypothetical protein GCM10023169_10850 [Georgenia halophila]|uniref:Polyketide cyclase / dehydrase and lipid transport n=1 Tax=Georgenia halophila TaxID=620889 RepID=A0ABP8KZL0_9MICO